jgi:hypothetical protein
MLASAALRAPSNSSEVSLELQSVVPQLEKYSPSLAPSVRRKIAEMSRIPNEQEGVSLASSEDENDYSNNEQSRPPSIEERVAELIKQAKIKTQAGDRKLALNMLDEARGLIGWRAKNPTQLYAQLQIIQAYAALDTARAFAMVESIIAQLNELASATAVVNGFLTEQELARDDELLLPVLFESFTAAGGQNVENLASVVLTDFERTKTAADSFQRNEVRIMAHLLIARSLCNEHRSNIEP